MMHRGKQWGKELHAKKKTQKIVLKENCIAAKKKVNLNT